MDGEAIEKIKNLVERGVTVELPDGTYASSLFSKIEPTVHHPDTVEMTTLASFVGFINDNPQRIDLEGAIVTVNPDFSVSLRSSPRIDGERDIFARAKSPIVPFRFANMESVEAFNISLLTLFKQDANLMNLFRTMQVIKVEDGTTIKDNGTSITVQVQRGVSNASLDTENIPSIVRLTPFRYFSECEQVEVPLLFRLRQSDTGAVYAMLLECDGGAWKVTAYQVISRKLKELGCQLPIYC